MVIGKRRSLLVALVTTFLSLPSISQALPRYPFTTSPNGHLSVANTKPSRKKISLADFNPFDNDVEDENLEEFAESLGEKVAGVSFSIGTILYGTALLLFSKFFPRQIHFITMMRSCGFDKIEDGIRTAKQNFRQAFLSAIKHAPSLYMMNQSLRDIDERIAASKAVKAEIRKANADGVVTGAEARKIRRMENRQQRELKRDIKRLKRGASAIGRIIEVLDFAEIVNIGKDFIFVMTAVLASGQSKSVVGRAISHYYHFLNLGSLILDVNRKMKFPLTRLIVEKELFDADLDEKRRAKVEGVGTGLIYAVSAYLTFWEHEMADSLNAALVGSSIVVRGLSSLTGVDELNVALSISEGQENHHEMMLGAKIKRSFGGVLMIFLSIVSLCSSKLADRGALKVPRWMKLYEVIEEILEKHVESSDELRDKE